MELDAFEFVAAMAKAHDDAIVGFRGNGKLARERFPLDDQGVVTRGGERFRQFLEDAFAIVLDLTGLSMEELRCADDFAAEGFSYCLVTQAHA